MIDCDHAAAEIDLRCPYLARIAAEPQIFYEAGALARLHALRCYDAMHLASALFLREARGEFVGMACYDDNLLTAAQREGLGRAL